MRVGFVGQSGPYAPVALRYLLAHRDSFEIALVVEGKRSARSRRLHRLCKPMRAKGQLGALANSAGVSVLETCDINARYALSVLAKHDLDWIVCVGFDRLFSAAVLSTARFGCLNAHPSLLPRWRGPSPLFWAAKNAERKNGVTIHGIDEREDHGPIYAQASFVAPSRASGEELYRLAAHSAGPLLVDVLRRAALGPLVGMAQNDIQATRAPRPRAEDVRVDPHLFNCDHLVDFCCAAPFFKSPWLRFGDDMFFVRRGILSEPGRRMTAEYVLKGSILIVQCRDGLARLEIQV